MGCIIFTDLQQFILELTEARRYVERRVIRVAAFEHEGFWCSSIHHDHLIATARISQDIVRLDLFYGPRKRNARSNRGMPRDVARLREACRKLRLQIGRGVLEEVAAL